MTTSRWLRRLGAALLVLAGSTAAAAAQQRDVRDQLAARGLPPDLVNGVAAVATDAAGRGLPTAPIADKALEGWAKRAAAERILSVVQAFTARMADGQTALRNGGMGNPPGEAIAAAAEAMGRGMTGSQVSAVARAGAGAETAPALHVVAALSSQGMPMEEAVTVVSTAVRNGRPTDQILDMPSAMRAMQAQGMAPGEIGRELMEGGGPGRTGRGSDLPGSGGSRGGGPGPGSGSGGSHPESGGSGHGPGGNRPPSEPPPPPEGGHGPR